MQKVQVNSVICLYNLKLYLASEILYAIFDININILTCLRDWGKKS